MKKRKYWFYVNGAFHHAPVRFCGTVCYATVDGLRVLMMRDRLCKTFAEAADATEKSAREMFLRKSKISVRAREESAEAYERYQRVLRARARRR